MSRAKVLVCDDSETEITRLVGILQSAGCDTVVTRSGHEALLQARAERPAVIFLDIIMPDMDGFEACRLINEDPELAEIPVIFVTSKDQQADKVWGKMQGARGFVVKPYTDDEIISHIPA